MGAPALLVILALAGFAGCRFPESGRAQPRAQTLKTLLEAP